MRKKSKYKKILILVFSLLIILSTMYLLHSISLLNGIEDKIRLLFSIDLVVIVAFIIFGYFRALKKHKIIFAVLLLVSILYIAITFVASNYIEKTYKVIDRMTTDSTTYSTSLVTLESNEIDDIKKIDEDAKIGMINDESSVAGYQLPKEAVTENNIKNTIEGYDSYIDLINDLYSEDIEYIFLPSNYVSMFSTMEEVDLKDIDEKTKIIYTKEKEEKEEKSSKGTSLTEPFSVLIMGVDSEKETLANSAFNGDALMLLTFDPKTLNTTILSIPRDSYVPIACFTGKKKNKITHAAWYGEKCMMNTISDFTGIDIDYYVKINFKGVVNIIDALGGVDVDVPYSFCEQDSNRKFGKNTIYVEKGKQKLNGEQALALSRNRKANSSKCSSEWTEGTRNDFVRGQNQQLVLRATLNKLKTVKSLDTIYDILDSVSKSMATNMTTNEILSLYNVGKDIIVKSSSGEVEDLLGIQKLYLNGHDARIYDPNTGLNLYNYILYDNSVNAVSDAMKVNLGKKKPTLVKKFSFSIDKPYEEEIIGKKETGGSSISYLPSFIGMSESTAKSRANNLGISVNVKYVTSGTGTNGTVIKQSISAGADTTYVKSITFTVLKKQTTASTTPSPSTSDENNSSNGTTNNSSDDSSSSNEDQNNSSSSDNVQTKDPVDVIPGAPTDSNNSSSSTTE